MVEILVEVEKIFGKSLPMAALFGAANISELARVLSSQENQPSEVIPLQPAGFLPPFFCFGAGPRFQPLANRLGTRRPFLSLLPNTQSAQFLRLRRPYKIEDVAAYSAKIICEYQTEGPYYLGGWSGSGVVAYEIAQQLTAMGRDVGLLVLFDTKNPAYSPRVFGGEWFEARCQKFNFFVKELKGLQRRYMRRYIDEKITELKRKMWVTKVRMNGGSQNKLEDIVVAALSSYQPRPYASKVMFFRPAIRPGGRVWDFSEGWKGLVRGGLEVHEIPGDHRSIFLQSNVINIAKRMGKYLAVLQYIFFIAQ